MNERVTSFNTIMKRTKREIAGQLSQANSAINDKERVLQNHIEIMDDYRNKINKLEVKNKELEEAIDNQAEEHRQDIKKRIEYAEGLEKELEAKGKF